MTPSTLRLKPPSVKGRAWLTPWLFLAAPLALYLFWIVGPMLMTFYLSLTNWDGISQSKFIGLAQYQTLFHDPAFFASLINNLRWLVIFTVVPVSLGLALAMVFNREMAGFRWFKAAIYSPMVLSFVVIGLIWSWMYHPANGLINATLRTIGLGALTRTWLADPSLATYAIIAAACWRQTGYIMIIYLAGLKTIDPTLVEAAVVDGANRWQLFWRVILPLLTPATIVVVIITIVDSLRSFDMVFVMTRGGPGYASTVLANLMYIEALNNYRFAYGSAIAVVQFMITFVFIAIYIMRTLSREAEY